MTIFFIRITICFLVFTPSVSAQSFFTVSGTVYDADNGETVMAAIIKAKGAKNVSSDTVGNYSIQVPAGEIEFTISAFGYSDLIQTVTVTGNMKLDFKLRSVSNELETVVVSVGKYEQKLEEVTVSMVVLKPTLLENKNTVNCETIMEQVPGVTVQDGQVSMRGGSGFAYGAGSRVLLLVDDMPMLSGDASDIKWNALPVENIEQIEVMKGASSVLYGSGALNGVVHVRTAYPREKPLTKINFTQGMYGDPERDSLRWWKKGDNPQFTGMYFLHSRQIKRLDLILGGAIYNDGGYREGEEENRFRGNFSLRRRSKIRGLVYGLNGNFQRAKGGLFIIWQDENNVYRPSGGANPDSSGSTLSRFNNDRFNFDPYVIYYGKNENRHRLQARYFNTTNRNKTDTVNQNSISQIIYWEYQYQKKFKYDIRLVSGVAGYLNMIDSYLYGDHRGTNAAVYTQLDKKFNLRPEKKLLRAVSLSAGVRLENYKLDESDNVSTYQWIRNGDTTTLPFQPVFRSGINIEATKSTFIRGSFGQGYRYPSVAERYVTTSVGDLHFFSNPALRPEYGWSAEAGIKQVIKISNWKAYFDVAYFFTHYENMTEFTFGVYNPDSIPLSFNASKPGYLFNWIGFRAENAEEAQVSGFEIELAGNGKIGKVELTTLMGYTYMNPVTLNTDSAYRNTFSDSTTTMLKYRFKHLFKADLQIDYKIISIGFSVRYNSFMVNVDKTFYNLTIPQEAIGFPLSLGDRLLVGFPSYRQRFNTGATVFDARIMVALSPTTKLGIIANNLLNTEYMGRPGDVQAPRNIAMQVNIKF